jgi:hypothetical protein
MLPHDEMTTTLGQNSLRLQHSHMPSVAETLHGWEVQRGLYAPEPQAIYVSTPITTGQLFVEWYRQEGYQLPRESDMYVTAHRANVVLPNVQRAARFIELLRWREVGLIVDPTTLDVPGWDQELYHSFWAQVLERHVRRVIFLDGWEFSRGCTFEFTTAQRLGLDCVDESLNELTLDAGRARIEAAIAELSKLQIDAVFLISMLKLLTAATPPIIRNDQLFFKDEILDHLARTANIAQFVSFGPDGRLPQRFCRIVGVPPNHKFGSARDAVEALLRASPEGKVNIRSFRPESPKNNPFVTGLSTVDEVLRHLDELSSTRELYTIVNERIDERDGGVSGVAYRGILDFAPDSNPRCVEDDTIERTTLPVKLGLRVLTSVYGFEPDLRGREGARVEFSIHPAPRGWRSEYTVIWEVEQRPADPLHVLPTRPSRFSRMLGDKVFGLLLATAADLPVPRTVVFTRRLFPFCFGDSTGTSTQWTRSSPEIKVRGYYPTSSRWRDPYRLLLSSNSLSRTQSRTSPPTLPELASVLFQAGVKPLYSGRMIPPGTADPWIAGVRGRGDAFMLGNKRAGALPSAVKRAVEGTYKLAEAQLGPVEIEWVYDGTKAWIVQLDLHERSDSIRNIEGVEWEDFYFRRGSLERLRQRVQELRSIGKGIRIIGNVSPLSHVGQMIEDNKVPVQFIGPGAWSNKPEI